jgi:hypothetical protein
MPARHRSSLRRAIFLFLVMVVAAPHGSGLSLAAGGDSTAVLIRVTPTRAIEPADVRVLVVIERDPKNRAMRITADSADYFTSSEVSIDGDRGPRVRSILLRDLPAGEYMFTGEAIGDGGSVRGRAYTSGIIAGHDGGQ